MFETATFVVLRVRHAQMIDFTVFVCFACLEMLDFSLFLCCASVYT